MAIQAALEIGSGNLKLERKRPMVETVTNYLLSRRPLIDTVALRMARDKIMKQTAGNYPAPLKILEVIRSGLVDGKKRGYEEEAKVKNFFNELFIKAFGELSQTFQSKALIGLFNGSTECKKDKYGDARPTK